MSELNARAGIAAASMVVVGTVGTVLSLIHLPLLSSGPVAMVVFPFALFGMPGLLVFGTFVPDHDRLNYLASPVVNLAFYWLVCRIAFSVERLSTREFRGRKAC